MGNEIIQPTNNVVIREQNNNIVVVQQQSINKVNVSQTQTNVNVSETTTNVTVQESSPETITNTIEEIVTVTQPSDTYITVNEGPTKVIHVVTAGPKGDSGLISGSNIHIHHITSSGNISSSLDLIIRNISASGEISASEGIITATGSIGNLTVGKATEPGILTIEKLGKIEFNTALINFFNMLGFTNSEGNPYRQPFISASGNGLGLFSPDEGTFHTYGKSGNNIEAAGTLENPNVTLQVRTNSVIIAVPYTGADGVITQLRVEEAKVTVGQATKPADLIVHGSITGSFISSSQDIYAGQTSTHGLILTSPGGLKYRLKVSDLGVLSTEVVP